MIIKLSPSKIATADTCGQKLAFQLKGIYPVAESVNLVFGKSIDDAIKSVISGLYLGRPFDGPEVFKQSFQTAIQTQIIEWGKTKEPDDMMAMGIRLMEQFPSVWRDSGLVPVTDPEGRLLMEYALDYQPAEGVVVRNKIDLLAYNRMGLVVVLDFKTTAAAHKPIFGLNSDQLTSYQIAVDAHRNRLGIDPVRKVGFMDFVKRKVGVRDGKGPEILPPSLYPRRSPQQVRDFQNKVTWLAEDIRRARLVKKSHMAFNSPCDDCQYANLCTKGSYEGLKLPEKQAA